MRPLAYLTYKTTFNGLKRAARTPRRIAYVVFFLLYYVFLINRVLFVQAGSGGLPSQFTGHFSFPPLDVVDGVAFGFFSISYLFMLIAMSSYQGSVRPADVDVLFPTPISPKTVLGFRIARDYFFTLITPLFIALIGMRASRAGWDAIFRNMPHPEYSGLALRAISVSWILMALCNVAVVHAVGLYINRTDRDSDRNRKLLMWGIGIYLVAIAAFCVYMLRQQPGIAGALGIVESPFLRVIFFLPLFATELAMAPFRGNFWPALLGLVGMFAIIVLSLKVAFRQIGWFYDGAAVKGFQAAKLRQLMRSGNQTGIMALKARQGKYRVRSFQLIYGLRLYGPRAIIWKELILQPRTFLPLLIIFFLVQIAVAVASALAHFRSGHLEPDMSGSTLIGMQPFMTLAMAMVVGQTGFMEVLRRIDLQKALPFRPSEIVWNEVLAKSIPCILAALIASLIFLCMNIAQWQYAVAAAILSTGMTVLIMAVNFLVSLLFPDIDDQSQRQFRGLMLLLAIVVTCFIPAVVAVVLLVVKVSPILAAVASVLVSALEVLALVSMAGNSYATFNPSE